MSIKNLTEDEVIEKYRGLAFKLAKKIYVKRRDVFDDKMMDFEDLVQLAYIGIFDAIRIFDESKGNTFVTLAWTCVQNRIIRDAFRTKMVNSYMTLNGISLDATINEDGDVSILELTGENDTNIEDISNKELQRKLFNRLSDREKEIIIKHNIEGIPYRDLAPLYNLSAAMVQKIASEAMARLKIQYLREIKNV